jgi:fatty-acid peroxygenase
MNAGLALALNPNRPLICPPDVGKFDETIALWREGYCFIANRCERLHTPIFRTRITLRRATCLRGPDAAQFFYEPSRFTRVKAMPITVLKLLQDFGSVQLLDGDDHHHRKRMFAFLSDPGQMASLCTRVEQEWMRQEPRWERSNEIVLFDQLRAVLTRAGCAWAGVPLSEPEAEDRSREFSEMIERTGSIGPRHWRALRLRRRSERWARSIVQGARDGWISPPRGSALDVISTYTQRNGKRLELNVAAVELINVLRAVPAVSRFIIFAALALHRHPEWRERARADGALTAFVEEVRRLAPFFPFIAGRALTALEWKGYQIDKGTWVLLDLYGTNHDPATWLQPDTFDPTRFSAPASSQTVVAQGAGDPDTSHRCPGERLTIELMKCLVRLLTTAIDYEVPEQNLSVDLARIPALPASGFVIRKVRAICSLPVII